MMRALGAGGSVALSPQRVFFVDAEYEIPSAVIGECRNMADELDLVLGLRGVHPGL